jgi:hypothetical protein
VDIAGGGGVERPEGDTLRMRKRCLNVVVRGEAGVGVCVTDEVGEGGGGGNGHVGGGLGGSSSVEGMTRACDKLECGILSTLVLRLCERDTELVLVRSSALHSICVWACVGGPRESRSARRASEFLRAPFTVVVMGHSVSDPVGVGGSALLGAGRGGGGTDRRWPPPRATANVPTCWADELVATLYMLLVDPLARFDDPCRLDMMLGSVLCDCEEGLGERSGTYEGNASGELFWGG